MRLFVVLLLACLVALSAPAGAQGRAQERADQLDRLFKALRAAPSEQAAGMLETRIRQLWVEEATPAAALLMARGDRDLHNYAGDEAVADFDAVFYPGGHGPLWDLAEDPASIALIEHMIAAGKPVAAVCHAPGVLRHVRGSDGKPLVSGKKVTGFTNTEEAAVGLTDVVPFLVEDMLKANGGIYSKVGDWQSYAITDGLLVTGQNPASSEAAAEALLKLLA